MLDAIGSPKDIVDVKKRALAVGGWAGTGPRAALSLEACT
jgi:hypothetical protein